MLISHAFGVNKEQIVTIEEICYFSGNYDRFVYGFFKEIFRFRSFV